jgi:class 3 adenylate cyclase
MAAVCPSCGRENPDEFAFCGHCGAALASAPAAREVRKTVTVLFADVVGSTSLGESRDPERVRTQMGRWFEQARRTIERHGGTVEKFAGDAVMAVFGVPVVHEDDALRAVRSAEELRSPELRIGVNTGEVVAGEGETMVTGDAVNVTARLEQAAAPGEVLIGSETRRLVRDAVETEPLDPLGVKGKAAPIEAYRLISVREGAEAIARHLEAPLVGRKRELERLRQDFEHAVAEQSCHLFTLLGPAGVGKSRLAADFLAAADARVVRGRCLSYGEGITYFPVVEVLVQFGAEPDSTIASSPAETQLAFRKLLEREATDGPLIVVFEDIQWAEPTCLDLIEHISDLSRSAPIFLLCIARPELLELRPTWSGGKLNTTTILLEPLSDAECEQLISALGGADGELQAKVIEAAQGNPLFVEEMLAMLHEEGDVAVPPTIHALLHARLDALGREERTVVERGAVEGQIFHRGPVIELAPEADVDAQLPLLIRKELIRPDASTFPGDDAYRFRHLLIRDAAYESLPKETRADLHERFAIWLEEHAELVEQDEIVGYHLEQAHRYRTELDQDRAQLAERAAMHLGAAGRAALGRADFRAAVNMLERAVGLLPRGDERRLPLVSELALALVDTGRFDDGLAYAQEVAESPDPRWRAHAALAQGLAGFLTGSQSIEEWDAMAVEARTVFEQRGDELGLARAILFSGYGEWARCHAQAAVEAYRAARHELETRVGQAEGFLLVQGAARRGLGRFAAMQGDFDTGRELMRRGRAALAEAGLEMEDAATAQGAAFVERQAGDLEAEERELRAGLAVLEELGEQNFWSTTAMQLADCLSHQGRNEEAEELLPLLRERSPEGDLVNFAGADAIEARLLARRGVHDQAERLALRAVEAAETTDFWTLRGQNLEALGDVYCAADRPDEARAAYERALAVYEDKGATVPAEKVRGLIAEL